MVTVKQRMKDLAETIIKHDMLYEENRPIITDSEYDALYFELMELERKHPDLIDEKSPTRVIYTKVVNNLKKIKHSTPMLSQDKATTLDRILDWRRQSPQSPIIIQHKMDGLTLVLTYEDGRLKQAVTRGNGEIGEDVLHNAMVIRNIPKSIQFNGLLEVRGEVVIPFAEFDRFNADGKYSNPRNLASGMIRQLDASKTAQIGLEFYAFDIANKYSIKELKCESDILLLLGKLGFTLTETCMLFHDKDGSEIQEELKRIESVRRQLPYMIDGAVIKFDDFKSQEELGYTSKFPKWAIAFKFQSLDATTELLSVDWQVGKSGQITPVANFNPVEIDGVTISRATLHNYQNIVTKDIRIGDTIVVARANDVIPYIQQSIKDVRDGSEEVIEKPLQCPSCGSHLTESNRTGDSPLIRCIGKNCEPQIVGKIVHWASRDALNLMSVGEVVVQDLYNAKIISSILDLYTNIENAKDFITTQMPGYGATKYSNIVSSIEKSKSASLSNILYGLSIDQIGLSTAKDIAKEFVSMGSILHLLEDVQEFVYHLQMIDGVAASVTEELLKFFGCWNGKPINLEYDNQNVRMIRELMSLGFSMNEPVTTLGDTFKGKTFVITGALSKPRSEIQKDIENLGGKVSGSVSKKTDYLLLGDGEENSSKHQKAKELNIPILSELEFINMMNI